MEPPTRAPRVGESGLSYILSESNALQTGIFWLPRLHALIPPKDVLPSAFAYANANPDRWLTTLDQAARHGYRGADDMSQMLKQAEPYSRWRQLWAWANQTFPPDLNASQLMTPKWPGLPNLVPASPALWVTFYLKGSAYDRVVRSAESQGANPQSSSVQQQAESAGMAAVTANKPAIMAELNATGREAIAAVRRDHAALMARGDVQAMLVTERALNQAGAALASATGGIFNILPMLPWIALAAGGLYVGGFVYKAWR